MKLFDLFCKESNSMERVETDRGHSRIRFAQSVTYKDTFILWGGKNYEDASVDDIFMIKLGIFSQ